MAVTTPSSYADQRRLMFRVGEQNYEIDATHVLEVVRVPHITRVPNGPLALAGLANLRGKPIPILAMARILDAGQADLITGGKVIVYDHGGALGLLVDDVLRSTGDTVSAPLRDLTGLLDATFKQTRLSKGERAAASTNIVQTVGSSKLIALLSFRVAGQTYGLPLEDILEVTAVSGDISVIANTSAAVIGLIAFRGGVLPLVSLATLLGLSERREGPEAPFAVVVEHEGKFLGLVVDGIDVIRRLPEDAIDMVPAVLQKGGGDAQIEAIGRLPDYGQLISILSPEKLFGHDAVTQATATNTGVKPVEAAARNDETFEQFLVFQLGEESYGLPVKAVDEVIRVPSEITRVPGAPDFVMGVINLRGKAIPLIDQRARFDTPSKHSTKARAIVLTIGHLQAGFVIDAVSEVKAISSASLSAAPEFSSAHTDVFDRIAHIEADGRMILLIDPQELLTRAERDVMAAIAKDGATVAGP